MLRKHAGQGREGQEDAERGAVVSVEVFIAPDGRVTVDGAPFPLPDGEPVNVAVLDTMQRRARAGGGPVEAVIVDRQAGYATRVEVTADGSSRIVRHERYRELTETDPPAEGPRPTDSGPDEQRPEGQRQAEPPCAGLSLVRNPSPDAPPGEGAPSTDGGTPVPVPGELAELVARIGHSIDTGARERAAALAFRLREHTARTFGAGHPYALEARALEAYAVYKGGNHTAATLASLELAKIRHQQGDARAHEDLLRAVAVWRLIDDLPSAVEHGRILLTTWSRLAAKGHVAAGDAELVRSVDRRIRALASDGAMSETCLA
ncbi:hypothetical protein [Streptomyces sp. IB2014 016-6]|uniref:hypothetical protein n=1 Tax=Streptomyces sp. IB2014 016-6 TaxID=2517818 RepID=UPI0011CA88E6|nr:hypothetical protein [Streptomyces sp. IB2014 016-6]TXL83872.1 hypothetical protein EW053_36060 [Streptomyces sp. IB2014 016-6]